MSLENIYDFEDYATATTSILTALLADGWLSGTNALSWTIEARTGTYSMNLAAGDDMAYRYPTEPTTVFCGFGNFQTGTAGAADDILNVQYNDGATFNDQITIGRDASNRIVVKRGATTLATSSVNDFILNNWQFFEVKVVCDDTNGQVVVRIDDAEVINFVGNTQNHGSSNVVNQFQWDRVQNRYVDDLYIGDVNGTTNNDFLGGETRVFPLNPATAGDLAQWTVSGAASNVEAVDEGIPNDDTDYNFTNVTGEQDLFSFDNLPVGVVSVYGVRVTAYARRTEGGSAQIKMLAKLNGITIKSDAINLDTTYKRHWHIFETKPGGGSWTPTDVDNAQFGYEHV